MSRIHPRRRRLGPLLAPIAADLLSISYLPGIARPAEGTALVFAGPIDDRLSIRERFDSYSDAVTRQALDDYLDCWTDDGARFGDGGECQGIDALRDHWHGIWKALSQMVFMTQIGAIVVDGVTATTRSYCLETLRFHDGTTRQLVGAYDDELRRVDGVWRFTVRRYKILLKDI